MPRKPTILLDMDCVLVDFIAGLAAAHGVPGGAAALYREQPRGRYDYTAALGRALGRGPCGYCDGYGWVASLGGNGRAVKEDCDECKGSRVAFTREDFWTPLNAAGAAFWAGLDPLPWAAELLDLTRSLTNDWYVVTAPSRCPGCVPGKQEWLNRLVGGHCDRLIPTKYKHLLARPGAVLIDDHADNCDRFEHDPVTRERTGGQAILFPAHHNRYHDLHDDPMPLVRAALRELV